MKLTEKMASPSKSSKPSVPESTDVLTKEKKGSVTFSIPDPGKDSQSLTVYQNQTLIPLTIQDWGFAYLGPYNPLTIVDSYKNLFSTHPGEQILA